MKKILVLSLVLMLILAACGKSGDGVVSESTAAPEQSATDTSTPADTAPAAKTPTDLHSVVNAVSAFGNFRDMMFVYSDDEYADDLLIFTFGRDDRNVRFVRRFGADLEHINDICVFRLQRRYGRRTDGKREECDKRNVYPVGEGGGRDV